ncbi:MAG: hypothetical protein H6Q30_2509 [Bacteroidetes bacterium]|nr:hypothetical protein [Bacteroidota bacterium]
MTDAKEHFAEDPELLERYVLDRLDRTSLAQCEEHLRTCATCRQAVQADRMIIAGVKRYGRDQMKERLRTVAGLPPTRRIPWPHVLGVAAILLILFGIGIYQRWFVTSVQPDDIAALQPSGPEEKAGRTAPDREHEKASTQQSAPLPPEGSAGRPEVKDRRIPAESNAKAETERFGYTQAPTDHREESAAAASKEKQSEQISPPSAALAAAQQEFWTSGTLIAQAAAKKDVDDAKGAKPMMSDAVRAGEESRAKMSTLRQVTVEQRPARNLPASQQVQQQMLGRQTIQTLVQQSGDATHLTLYPESPFDSTQLLYARAQQISTDSLVIHIGSQQIGYRLPVGALRQLETDPAKSKR